jgi:hypothetical protein
MHLHGFSLFTGVLIGFLVGGRPFGNYLETIYTGGGLRGGSTIARCPTTINDLGADASQRQPRVMFVLTSMENDHATSSSTAAIPLTIITEPTTDAGNVTAK